MDYNRLAVSKTDINKRASLSGVGSYFRALAGRAGVSGLRFKLLALVTGISLISLLSATFLLFRFQRQQIIDNAAANTTALSNTLKANLRHAMISVDRGMASEILGAVAAEKTVKAARILDAQGVVTSSSARAEIGLRYDRSQQVCQVCHASPAPTTEKTAIFSTGAGQPVLLNVNVLENEPDCQLCHTDGSPVLGVLMIETPLDVVQKQLNAGYMHTGFLALGTFAVLVGVLVLALRRYIVEPVEKLEKGVAEISGGNFDGHIQVATGGELGQLAHSLNAMRAQLRTSRGEMEERNQELALINEVSLTISQSLDLQEILDRALEMLTARLGIEAGFIRLLDPQAGRFTLRAYRGASEALCQEIERRRAEPGGDISAEMAQTGRTFFAASISGDDRLKDLWDNQDQRSYILVPLKSKGSTAGTLSLVSYAGRPISDRTVVVIEAIANEIGIAIHNAQLLAESHRNEHEAITLSQVGMQVSASLALREVLSAVAEAARRLLDADIGLVGLLDPARQELVLKAAAGARSDGWLGTRNLYAADGMPGQPVMGMVDAEHRPPLCSASLLESEAIASYLAVPLERGGQRVGLVQVMTRQPRCFLPRDAQLLARLAHHVVVAIENAQLYRQLRYLAVLEERDRIAGEMHDHVSQTLGYMNIKTSLIEDLLRAGQMDQARAGLSELKDAGKIAYNDVREAIFNLRTSVAPGLGLLGSLRDYLAEYRTYYGLDAYLDIEDEDLAQISPETAAQLFRIIQEALVNVRKHASARKVHISCQPAMDHLCITIADDGRGFTPGQIAGMDRQHFGLQIMRERAESVHGSLELHSLPGQGTRVIVRIPVQSQQEEVL